MNVPGISLRKRIVLVLLASLLAFSSLAGRVAWLQFVRGDELRARAQDARTRDVQVEARRGVIYDQRMRELAVSVNVDSLYAVPREVDDPTQVASKIAGMLDMDPVEISERLGQTASFVWIKRKLPEEVSYAIRQMKIPGLYFTQESRRFYPKGTLAAHVLGFAGIDSQGLEGVEYSHDHELRGQPGRIVLEFDAQGREIPQAKHHYIPPVDGDNLVLTIDEVIQYVVERELDKTVAETGAKGGLCLVMEPKSGDILAMAARPTYDPNFWSDFPPSQWRNPCISDTQHPGSVFKPITACAAVEEGRVTPETGFYDPGYVKVPGWVINNWNNQGLGSTTFAEGFEKSANVIFVKVGLSVGIPDFYRYLRAFGFESPLGIDLPGEATALYPAEEKATVVDLAVMSFGQTIAVTPLQMVSAMSAIANGGYLMRPRVVKAVQDAQSGEARDLPPVLIRRVISSETAAAIRQLMVQVVEKGTGSRARVPGYSVGGKTGTSQKSVGGRVVSDRHVSSFCGLVPAGDPALVVLLMIDEPQGIYYGGVVAAPAVQAILTDALHYLEVPPDKPDEVAGRDGGNEQVRSEGETVVPSIVNLSREDATRDLAVAGLSPSFSGAGETVLQQFPPAGSRIPTGSVVLAYTERNRLHGSEVTVPDLSGHTLRAAAEYLGMLGLRMEAQGSGIVKSQSPGPGVTVPRGTVVKISLSPGS